MDMRETRISGEYFFEGRIMKARVDEVRLPNGKQASREVCEHVGGVGVLPIDQDGNIILVRQFRYPFDTETLEMPAGKMDHGPENAEECGVRELAEETGCTAGRIVPLGAMYPSPGCASMPSGRNAMTNRPPSGCGKVTDGWNVRRMVSSISLHFSR